MIATKLKIIEKAWTVWHDGMIGGFPEIHTNIEDIPVTYAKTPGQAKTLSSEIHEFYIYGEPHKYTDLKVRRAKGADKVRYNDEILYRWQVTNRIEMEKEKQEFQDKVNSVKGNSFYVQHGFVGNSILWWATNGNGYTTNIDNAQVYSKDEILSKFVNKRSTDYIWLASHVNSKISKHVDSQHVNYDNRI